MPQVGINARDREQYDAFFKKMAELKKARGRDGRPAFTIPLSQSSSDPAFRRLDSLTMLEFLKENGWDSKPLHWYVNYCCRDDYGMGAELVSAWAGVHYFASRSGEAANSDSHTVLTWPEGNGWLVEKMRAGFESNIRGNSLVFSVEEKESNSAVEVAYFDPVSGKSSLLRAKHVIFAAPRFVAAKVVKPLAARRPSYLQQLQYAPWMVANVTLRSLPTGRGAPLSWDNVSYYGRSLGYVVATHQQLALYPHETVLTFFLPLDEEEPSAARHSALAKPHAYWAELVAENLERMHPGIRAEIGNIDVMLWGHGMISPRPGFIWGEARREMAKKIGRVHFAHSDMSGISIFEEAQYHGVEAAKLVLSERS